MYTDAAVSNTPQQPLLELYSTVEASDYETPVNTINKQAAALYIRKITDYVNIHTHNYSNPTCKASK